MNALGQALVQHRAQCTSCTLARPCGQYLTIVRKHTEPRRRYTGSTAPSTVLSGRETCPSTEGDC